jgi:hypothetical protein
MKTIFISLLLLLVVNLSADELKWVDEQIKAIKPPRAGMEAKALAKIKDPFIYLSKAKADKKYTETKSVKTIYRKSSTKRKEAAINSKFRLSMIINKAARINDKWYKLGETIAGYKIAKIDLSFVKLSKDKKNFLLSTHSKNRNLNFKN